VAAGCRLARYPIGLSFTPASGTGTSPCPTRSRPPTRIARRPRYGFAAHVKFRARERERTPAPLIFSRILPWRITRSTPACCACRRLGAKPLPVAGVFFPRLSGPALTVLSSSSKPNRGVTAWASGRLPPAAVARSSALRRGLSDPARHPARPAPAWSAFAKTSCSKNPSGPTPLYTAAVGLERARPPRAAVKLPGRLGVTGRKAFTAIPRPSRGMDCLTE